MACGQFLSFRFKSQLWPVVQPGLQATTLENVKEAASLHENKFILQTEDIGVIHINKTKNWVFFWGESGGEGVKSQPQFPVLQSLAVSSPS